jgi:hypothetical protein
MSDNYFEFDYIYDWSDKKIIIKDLSKSVFKDNFNFVKRIEKKNKEKEKNIEDFGNYATDILKTNQEDYNNIDDNVNEIGRINTNNFKFMSSLNMINTINEKKISTEENKNEDLEIKNESKEEGCNII